MLEYSYQIDPTRSHFWAYAGLEVVWHIYQHMYTLLEFSAYYVFLVYFDWNATEKSPIHKPAVIGIDRAVHTYAPAMVIIPEFSSHVDDRRD